jgi:hypothetical protein
MHESVERRTRWSQSEVALYNQISRLCSVNRLARRVPCSVYTLRTFVCRSFIDLVIWRVRQPRVFVFDQYYIIYYSVYDLILNLIERLGLTWLLVLSLGGHIRVWILFYFIILFYLADLFEILVCPKDFLFWLLVGSEKVRSSHLAPGWYRESLTNSCLSRIVISFWWYGN